MSNIKIYTEEQVIDAITKSFLAEYPINGNDILNSLTPIELPSDEEIRKEVKKYIEDVNTKVHKDLERDGYLEIGFRECAKWMKQQILNQNK